MFKKYRTRFVLWVEEYLFYPKTLFQYLLSFLLLPFMLIYCCIVIFKRVFANKIDFHIPIVSVGNLTIGGSGKTPVTIALAKERENCAVILRGYGRHSKGLVVVSNNHEILCSVSQSGDEAIVYAKSLPKATVIVSEDRIKAIKCAKEMGCKIIFLDDAFSKSNIKKFDILIRLEKEPTLPFCLPSGAYREPKCLYKTADLILRENIDFKRVVKLRNQTTDMVLVTAISNPKRLDKYLPENLKGKIYFEDHHSFTKDELADIIKKYNAASILTTQKDAVKMENFGLNLCMMELDIVISKSSGDKINDFLITKV